MARYDEEERKSFYEQMVYVGVLLTQHGVPVIFDYEGVSEVIGDLSGRGAEA